MKKLYRKSTVHPSPPPPSHPPPITDPLAFLPAAIFTLAAALTPEDREVLAYLLSCSSVSSTTGSPKQGLKKKGGAAHPPEFSCDCFSCYTSYWARWDSSPNRQLIHEIIDAYEDRIPANNRGSSSKNRGGRRDRKKKAMDGSDSPGVDQIADVGFAQTELGMPESVVNGGEPGGSGGGVEEEMVEKGSVKKLVNFIGERIWSFWG